MAIFGFDLRTISKLDGGSVAKSAAYILRTNIRDHYLNKTHYYNHVQDLVYSEVLVPDYAPEDFLDLDTLLSTIDKAEKRYDARTGREIRLSLPNDKEISDNDRITLVREFVKDTFISRGMCGILAIHEGRNEVPEKCNPHCHVILTDRPVDEHGFCATKDRSWNRKETLIQWREMWADSVNQLLKERGIEKRVSHLSLEVQGIDREPTIPLGRAATALERKGILTEPGNHNRAIAERQREKEERRQRHYQRRRERSR